MSNRETDATRWKDEAEFFDRQAEQAMASIAPVHPRTIARYRTSRRRRFSKEFRFRVLGPLRGKSLLDVGCGDGTNAMNFALLGAHVTGIDISPRAVELAIARAEVNGVADLARFVCSPLETAAFPDRSFDIVWGDAILHHLIHDLDNVLRKVTQWAKPGALVMFAEPVNFSPALRRLRKMVPIRTDATPDERPLEPAEVKIIARHLPDLQVRPFSLFTRLNRFVLVDYNYEESSLPRRALSNALSSIDYMLLSIPGVKRAAGTCVFFGHTRR